MNYAKIAFTDAIKALQEDNGSRAGYARMEKNNNTNGFTPAEEGFISERDSFYMATIGENGFPYIQHRGGPKGFMKVLDHHTLGVVDFSGNKQYISVGNAATNQKVSLFLMDYPNRSRLKLYADIRIVEIEDDPGLFKLLDPDTYKHKAERMMIFDVKAYDWNCPQHITQRYTMNDIETAFADRNAYVRKLEMEVELLRTVVEKNGLKIPKY
ncbi:pyridoxamine 5'-phosphate oxidase family protein [Inquilinus sp. KBS0705]|nr:pyridoxamine 5'-phosphate oxidase family protein [Inquilinus sp. KBS0705]